MLRNLPVNNSLRSRRRAGEAGGSATRLPHRNESGPQTVVPTRTLSAMDAAFLYLERKELPLAIACLTIFDGPIPFEEFMAQVASRLRWVPRYRQIVVAPPLNMDLPTWEEDKHFDIRRHVFRVVLDPPGGEKQLEALIARIFSQLLDRKKPLWEIYVVDGLKDGRNAVIWRLHHALADGISANRLLDIFLDTTPDGSASFQPPLPRRPAVSEPAKAGGIAGAFQTTLKSLIATERGLLGFTQALLGDSTKDGSKSLVSLLPEFMASVERLPFNKPCREGRKFCWAEFDMAEVKAIREVAGARVNDVILAMLTLALARYVKLHKESIVNRLVRVLCPVNLRKPGEEESMGNQISFMPVALPLDVRDPIEMLRAVAVRTEAMKNSGAAALVGLMAFSIAKMPPPLQSVFWWWLGNLILPVPLFNTICTNMPGPPQTLYALGRRMIATYPQVPTGYELGINLAIESYDGKLFFGLIADAHAAPDVDRLRDFLYVAFEELRQGARKARGITESSQPKKNRVRRAGAAERKPSARRPPGKSVKTIAGALEPEAAGALAEPAAPLAPASAHAPVT